MPGEVSTWEAVLVGVLVLVLLMFLGPGIRNAVRNSPKPTAQDWKSLVLPLGLVVAFVALLLALV